MTEQERDRDQRARTFYEQQRANPLLQNDAAALALVQTPWEELPEIAREMARAAVGWWPELVEEVQASPPKESDTNSDRGGKDEGRLRAPGEKG